MDDKQLWEYRVRFDDALKGQTLELVADEARRKKLEAAFGMQKLISLTATIRTLSKVAVPHGGTRSVPMAHIEVSLKGEVTQECAVSLEPFTHGIEADIEIDCIRAADYVPPEETGENELSLDDLDEPDVIEGPEIDIGLYVIEALGEAYDPFARKPGVVFVEPEPEVEPSPFAVLAKLKTPDDPA